MTIYNLISFTGIFVLAFVAWLLSSDRKTVNWRVVTWGIGLQLLFAFFVFVVPAGTKVFLFINDAVVKVLDSAQAGTRFIFGRLALPPGATNESGETSLGSFLLFQGLATIIFFAALIGALYHAGIMPFFIRLFSRVFTKTMGISGAESLSVSSNIFVGVESSLVVKPHLSDMTLSELTTIITAGMATIASTVLAVYVIFLNRLLPTIAGHLVSASIIAAPASIVMAKLIMPETGRPRTLGLEVKPHYEREDNIMVAVINGANDGLKLLGGIVALLLAVLGLLALLDMILGWAPQHALRPSFRMVPQIPVRLPPLPPDRPPRSSARGHPARLQAPRRAGGGHGGCRLPASGRPHGARRSDLGPLGHHRLLRPLRIRPFRFAGHFRRRNRGPGSLPDQGPFADRLAGAPGRDLGLPDGRRRSRHVRHERFVSLRTLGRPAWS
jgi:nucleoside transporter